MNIVGISAGYHESSCCLLRNGELIAAAAEERFSRLKHDSRLPVNAFRYCLSAGGLTIADLDAVAYYESPAKKLGRQLWAAKSTNIVDQPWLDGRRAEREIRERLGYEGSIECFDHHLSHAASSFLYSGFEDAAILTVDGVGEWATTTYGRGHGHQIELFEEVCFPHSLGLLYSTLTNYLGFRVNGGEYKVMGLAPYGQPQHLAKLRQLLRDSPRGQYTLDLTYFDFSRQDRMYTAALNELLGEPPRPPESELTSFHRDLACSLQRLLEEVLLRKVRYLANQTTSPNLVMAGGVALNCVANGHILRHGPFERLFVQPAAGDAGGCLGAAALAYARHAGARPSKEAMRHVYLGPEFGHAEIARLLAATGITAEDFSGRTPELLEAVVDRLAAGRVVAWFQGRMEFGPRALGARSILADPRNPEIRQRLNQLVKKRENFRPFAPSVLRERAAEHFDLPHDSPFMLEVCQVRSPLDLPAITHVDGSARPQTVDRRFCPRYAALLDAFDARTGCPVLVNTSFNVRGEPIVATPVDALLCLASSGIESLALGDFLIDRSAVPEHWIHHIETVEQPRLDAQRRHTGINEHVYTFL